MASLQVIYQLGDKLPSEAPGKLFKDFAHFRRARFTVNRVRVCTKKKKKKKKNLGSSQLKGRTAETIPTRGTVCRDDLLVSRSLSHGNTSSSHLRAEYSSHMHPDCLLTSRRK